MVCGYGSVLLDFVGESRIQQCQQRKEGSLRKEVGILRISCVKNLPATDM